VPIAPIVPNVPYGFQNLTISAQNCNSLNLTGVSTNLDSKVAAITSTRTDIIFISDIRLVSPNGVPSDERVGAAFRDAKTCSYQSFFNSTRNARGVGILLSNNINFKVINQVKDANQNFLVMKIEIDGVSGIFGSVYGPNTNDRDFFKNLERAIRQLNSDPPLPIFWGETGILPGITGR